MRYTQLLIPTLREAPADAEVISHQLMMRAGYIRKLAAGVYTYLPLCLRTIRKVEKIVREEMEAKGAQELLLPIVMPAELWQETGRWDYYGKELLRFKDRHDRPFCIGPTHEEAITDLLRHEIKSWRDMPKNCFQIQTKFRDEVRPRFGLMRGREFIMKDGYSFDRDVESSMKTYDLMYDAYKRIFTRCGLKFRPVEATTGAIGGSRSHEFQVLADSGEDEILACTKCEYAANVERAGIGADKNVQPSKSKGSFKKVATPHAKSVDEVASFLKVTSKEIVKTLIYDTDKGPIAAIVRGDHDVMETKLKEVAGVDRIALADEALVEKVTQAPQGFAGPVGLEIPIYCDQSIAHLEKFIVGANERDAHLMDVQLADFEAIVNVDIRRALKGDSCPRCGAMMDVHRGIEVGQVFHLGTKYSEPMKAQYLNEDGKPVTIVMGCYGIGIGRTAAAAIEQNHDERGIIWPLPIAPFHCEVIPLAADGEVLLAAEEIYSKLNGNGVEALIDDRDERAGVKFNDADLIGMPYRIIVGAKGLKDGIVELKDRRGGDALKLSPADAVAKMIEIVREGA